MKITEIAPLVLNIIKNNRKVNAKDISRISGLPIRRIYDITVVLEALELVDVDYSNEITNRSKIFTWRENNAAQLADTRIKLNSRKIKVFCVNGTITRIQNNPMFIIIEGSHNLTVEKQVDFPSK